MSVTPDPCMNPYMIPTPTIMSSCPLVGWVVPPHEVMVLVL